MSNLATWQVRSYREPHDRTSSKTAAPATALPDGIGDAAVALARRWAHDASGAPSTGSAQLLAQVLKDESGLAFTIGFVDRVVRPEDLRVAAHELAGLASQVPAFLPWYMRAAVRCGGVLAPVLPGVVVPVARRVLRGMVGHLVVDATPREARAARDRRSSAGTGTRLNLNLLGEAVLGDAEAEHRLDGTRALLARDDVDYVSIKVSSIVSQLSMWAFDETVERVVEKLTPLYELAASAATPKFINLDMEEYRDLDLTDRGLHAPPRPAPSCAASRPASCCRPTCPTPSARCSACGLGDRARRRGRRRASRCASSRAPTSPWRHVDATLHGWPLATYGTKQQTDTNYKRVLDWALTPERPAPCGSASPATTSSTSRYAWLLAEARGVHDRVEFEMLLGMADGAGRGRRGRRRRACCSTRPSCTRGSSTSPSPTSSAASRRTPASENFMSAVFELASNEAMFEREKRPLPRLARRPRASPGRPRPGRTRTASQAPR